MALHMPLMVNQTRIGYLYVQRLATEHPAAGDVCRYNWRIDINGRRYVSEVPLEHRFGDGAWALVARVIEAAGLR